VLLHGALVAVLVYGWLQFRKPPPPINALAIDATVVPQATLDAAQRSAHPPAPVTPPPSPPAEPVDQAVPPPPDPAVQKAAAEAEAAHAAAAEAAQQAQERAAAQRAADRAAARKQADEAAAREAADEKAAAAKAAQEKAARAKAAEEQSRKEAAQAEAKAKAAAAAKAQAAANQADLQRSIDAEEKLDAARASGAMSSWVAQITARIQRAWIRPPSARAGLECTIYLTQVPGGEITNVRLGSCNGDDAVKQSILDAAYRASPLPAPSDPSLFERNLEVTFRPTD
jgi:colicin import membrane protein